MSVDAERDWWNGLEGDEVYINAYGLPNYPIGPVIKRLMGWLERALRPDSVILDLGCGPGRLTWSLAWMFESTMFHGVDFAEAMIRSAKPAERTNLGFVVNDGLHLPSHPARLDGAYAVTVFQHLSALVVAEYLNQIADRLVPGGRLVFTISEGRTKAFLDHRMTVEEATEFANIAGLEIVATERDPIGWTWMVAER